MYIYIPSPSTPSERARGREKAGRRERRKKIAKVKCS
jgi:hypothetical protein